MYDLVKVHTDCTPIFFQQEGPIDNETVTHQDYVAAKGDRFPTRKPEDSDVFRGDGSFISETTKNIEYTAKKGERYEAKRHEESDIWKVIAKKNWGITYSLQITESTSNHFRNIDKFFRKVENSKEIQLAIRIIKHLRVKDMMSRSLEIQIF